MSKLHVMQKKQQRLLIASFYIALVHTACIALWQYLEWLVTVWITAHDDSCRCEASDAWAQYKKPKVYVYMGCCLIWHIYMVKDMNQYALYGTCCIQTDASKRASCRFRVVEGLHEAVQLMLVGFVLHMCWHCCGLWCPYPSLHQSEGRQGGMCISINVWAYTID